LNIYCTGDECSRWNRLKDTRTIMTSKSSDLYFAQLTESAETIGFTSIGEELMRDDDIVFNRPAQQIFIADRHITQQPFSFAISKKRRDLVEAFNRAITFTSAIYPRIMTSYHAPYGVYSHQVQGDVLTPLSLSNLDAIWLFFGICLVGVLGVFVIEIILGWAKRRRAKK
ncbi:hypothetical protein PMAYCL1PPCAC_16806, partial [Pristionchus mayeri]